MGLFSRNPAVLPTTSYGYIPPPGATASQGWSCSNSDCGTRGELVPKKWPFSCPSCGSPADPQFDEPWAQQARGPWLESKLREDLAAGSQAGAQVWQSELYAWRFDDALRRGDRSGARAAQEDLHQLIDGTFTGNSYPFYGGMPRFRILLSAIEANDPDTASAEAYDALRRVPLDNLEESNDERANVRQVINLILTFIEAYPSYATSADLLQQCGLLVVGSASVLPSDLEMRYRAISR